VTAPDAFPGPDAHSTTDYTCSVHYEWGDRLGDRWHVHLDIEATEAIPSAVLEATVKRMVQRGEDLASDLADIYAQIDDVPPSP
jgi:hypothetical protein